MYVMEEIINWELLEEIRYYYIPIFYTNHAIFSVVWRLYNNLEDAQQWLSNIDYYRKWKEDIYQIKFTKNKIIKIEV